MYFSAICIDYVDSARRSSARRRQTIVGWGKQAIAKCVNISKTVGDTSKFTIYD